MDEAGSDVRTALEVESLEWATTSDDAAFVMAQVAKDVTLVTELAD